MASPPALAYLIQQDNTGFSPSIPEDYRIQRALILQKSLTLISENRTQLVYGMTSYHTGDFGRALDEITPAGGTSPLEAAFDAAIQDFKAVYGKKAVIIVSDGKNMSDRVIPAARKLADAYGDSLCIYPILIGNDPQGLTLMTELAGLTGCGFLTRDTQLLDNNGLNTFVHKVFLDKTHEQTVLPPDHDNDGVIDNKDRCPDTPAGVAVTANGCPVESVTIGDEDGDGVRDDMDQCPGTPQGAKVGISADRLETEGVGFSMPLVPNTSPENRAMNRRTEIHPLN